MALVERGTLVLIVDDEVDVRQGLADVLVMEGYDARPLPTADTAWSEIARGAAPALIILDLWLPGMSSGEFVRRLRRSHAALVPVMVLSGSPAAAHIEADVDAVLLKPMEAASLVHAVDKLVAERSPMAAPAALPKRRRAPAAGRFRQHS
jgi:DNA-binding response OmpR family regulator